jgi:phosphocarrier protein HPr
MDRLARPNFHLFPRIGVTGTEANAPFSMSMQGARFEIAAGNSVDPHALSRVGVNAAATEQPTAVREVTVRNKQGIHARPSSQFVKIASRHPCEVFIEKDGEVINGKSIMGLLMLAAGPGSLLRLFVPDKALKLLWQNWLRLWKTNLERNRPRYDVRF